MGETIRGRDNCGRGPLGIAAIFLFPENSIPHQVHVGSLPLGISCGGAAFYWPSKTACVPTILVELIPLSVRFFFKGDETGIVTGIVILLFCAVVLRMALYLNLSAEGIFDAGTGERGPCQVPSESQG